MSEKSMSEELQLVPQASCMLVDDDVSDGYMITLPTEVLLYIFSLLPGKDLMKCRLICQRWKDIIDEFAKNDILWLKHCKIDFAKVYKIARLKARSSMSWFEIYKSLALWSRLNNARETRDEFAVATTPLEEILNFVVLRDGVIGVHKKCGIMYYDVETLETHEKRPNSGDFINYRENEDTFIILSPHLHLHVLRKVQDCDNAEPAKMFHNVKDFILAEREVYFVNLKNEIFLCKLNDELLSSTLIARSQESILCMAYNGCLIILTFERNIYAVVNNNLILQCHLDGHGNVLHQIYDYHLLGRLDWRLFFEWLCHMGRSLPPQGPLRNIVTVRAYGDIFFVGCRLGVLRIYYKPYTDGKLDLYNAEPIKQYNFSERYDCPVLSLCPILQVDVLEKEDGHKVIVAMPKKIAILDFIHNFKRNATAAMLPQCDIERVKVLRIQD